MGRNRRRDRRFRFGNRPGGNPPSSLKPMYVTTEAAIDPRIAPALPLEGFTELDAIKGPALMLEDAPADTDEFLVAESTDPSQLSLDPVIAESGDEDDDAAVALEAVAELEILTEAARADAHMSEVAADLIARVIEESAHHDDGSQPPPADDSQAETPAEPPAVPSQLELEAPALEVGPEPEPEPEPEPDPIDVMFAQAQDAAQGGRSDEARALYRQLLALRPLHVRARNNLALLLDAAGDHTGALAELDRALDVDQDNTTLLVNRGALLGALGRFQAAERDLKRVLRVEPSNAEALFNLGVVMCKKGLWAEAVPALKRAIEIQGDRAAAHFYLGEALNHVDDLPGAMLSYQRAAELMPGYSRALYGLGIVYDRMGRPDDAAVMYRRSREVAAKKK